METHVKWIIDPNDELPLAIIEDTEDGEGVLDVGRDVECKADASPVELEAVEQIIREHNSLPALTSEISSLKAEIAAIRACDTPD